MATPGIFQSVSPADQAQGGAMPMDGGPINTMPGASPQFDIIGTVQKLLQMPQYQEAQKRLSDVGAREKGVSQQMQDLADNQPKSAYQPSYEHGAGVGGALRNVGRGVLQGLSLTGPGQAVSRAVYAPGQRAYEQRKEALAGEMQSLKGEEETGAEGIKAISGATGAASTGLYRGGQLALGQEKVNVSQERAELKAQEISNNYKVQLQRLEQGSQRLSLQEKTEKATEWYHRGLLDAYGARTAAGQDENSARIGAQEDMKAAAQESSWRKEHWFLNMIGATPTGASVSAPGAGSPKPTVVKSKAAGGGAMVYARDPQGKLHQAPAGTPLPQGWKTEKR